jgi:NAD(P)-dependent dehydrogenase (short-subunit alcohol dehydrogenase family)
MADVMIVTGASRGIGAATAIAAGRAGYSVCVNYRSSPDRAAAVVDAIRAGGGTALAVPGDVGDDADVLRLFATVDGELGPVRVLVNNAGSVGEHGPLADITVAGLRRLLDVNVVGAFVCAREAAARMSTLRGGSGGVIVNVSSRAAVLGGPNEWVTYAASKGAIDTMTVGLSKELATAGIRVNAVRPGLIDTDIHDAAPPGRLDRLVGSVPAGRPGSAEEVAHAILWLASDAASYVTGTILFAYGGWTAADGRFTPPGM